MRFRVPGRGPLRYGAVAAIAAATAVIVWLVTSGGDHAAKPPLVSLRPVSPIGPIASTRRGLAGFSDNLHQQIYWAGPVTGDRYELTETTNGDIYVRYLPPGVKAGDPRARFLIVATYPFPNAIAALKRIAHGKGETLANGAFVLANAADPRSVHLAFPHADYQIEVFDPRPAQAMQVAMSGRIRAIG